MGLYATLLDTQVPCPRCQAPCPCDWQFHFGELGHLPQYRLGDRIAWGLAQPSPTVFGHPAMAVFHAVAYANPPGEQPVCAACGLPDAIALLHIEGGVLRALNHARDLAHVPELGYDAHLRPLFLHDLRNKPNA